MPDGRLASRVLFGAHSNPVWGETAPVVQPLFTETTRDSFRRVGLPAASVPGVLTRPDGWCRMRRRKGDAMTANIINFLQLAVTFVALVVTTGLTTRQLLKNNRKELDIRIETVA